MPLHDLENLRDVPQFLLPEIKDTIERAEKAGAEPPLLFVGAGQYGIVLCGAEGHAWKVARLARGDEAERLFMRGTVEIEYEWLRDAEGSSIAKDVAEVYSIDTEELVLERECVEGVPGAWADYKKVHTVHDRIDKAMIPRGWTAPEFKENSYIIRPDGTPVLVDISMAMRVGENLVRYVDDILEERRRTRETWHDLAFALLSEMRQKTVPQAQGRALVDRLIERDPEIRKGFSIPW